MLADVLIVKRKLKFIKMKISAFHFENGVFVGYYVIDKKGTNWAVQPTKQKALDWYNKLNDTSILLTEIN